jgi:hypothetical protein
MQDASRGRIEQLNAEDVERVYRCTDGLRLRRDRIVVPRGCAENGREILFPDGRILLRAPRHVDFEAWLNALPGRLAKLSWSWLPSRPGRRRPHARA